MTIISKILGEPVAEPVIGEIRKVVCVIMCSGFGWDAVIRRKYYWTRKAANNAHPRLVSYVEHRGASSIRWTTIRVVWAGKCWNVIGQAVRPR